MRIITEERNLKGKYVIVRSSCNVPLDDNGQVTNRYRLKRALPTLQFLRDAGARTILLAHIGREETDTLRPVFDAFLTLIPMTWGGNVGKAELLTARNQMSDGDIVMVENLRQDAREANNDTTFAAELAELGDIYVDDAFDNIHREHASMVGIPTLLPSFAGITLAEEVAHLSAVMTPQPPALLMLGGAKFETKLPLIEKYLALYDQVFVGGALANDILLADGHTVGTSLVSEMSLRGLPFLMSEKLLRPVDVVVTSERGQRTCAVSAVMADEKIIDMGPDTVAMLAPYITNAKTILWNGPLGIYESGAGGSTEAVAQLVANSAAMSVIGGGDTVAAVEALGINDKFGFVSIGGGAMLTLLESGTTPALTALGYRP